MKITTTYPGLSLNEVRAKYPNLFYDQNWYKNESFADEKFPAATYEFVSGISDKKMFDKTYVEQVGLLPKGFEIPPVAAVAYAVCEHFEKTGKHLLKTTYVRTSSVDSDGGHVCLGDFDAGGLFVRSNWDDKRHSGLGLASSRKVEAGTSSIEAVENLRLESRITKIEAILSHHNLGIAMTE